MKGEELSRIEENTKGATPNGTKLTISVNNIQNPKEVLEKSIEIMKCISQFAYTNQWPDDEAWKTILPLWFVESMTSKSITEIMDTKGNGTLNPR
jgi:hypothetical protein